MLTNSARPLRRYLPALILLSALWLCSCSPMKKTLQSRQTITTDMAHTVRGEQTTAEKRTEAISATAKTETDLQTQEQVVTIVEEFDTSLPVDAATGTPPLKGRITSFRQKIEQGHQTVASEQTAQVVASAEITASTQSETSGHIVSDADVDLTEKRGLNIWQKLLCGLGILALLYLGMRLLLKHVKLF